jgi:hypothetical protein
MRRWLTVLTRVALVVTALLALGSTVAQATPDDAQARARLAGVRVPFIANQDQTDSRVAFYAPTFAGTLFVTKKGVLVYSLPGWTLTERLPGGRVHPMGWNRSSTGVGYFFGSDPARWQPSVPAYDQLSLGEVWPGITVALRARGRSVEKVFTVKPGGSVSRIRVRVNGASALAVNGEGALVARTGLGPVAFTAPVAYQEQNGVRREVAVAYRLTGREYGFTAAAYDPALPLVIDPLLQSTYLGGSDDDPAYALVIHPNNGDVYVAGSTLSTNFPHTTGGFQPAIGGKEDAFVARLNSSLTSVIQATYVGGSDDDVATALAVDPVTGDVYVTGRTSSSNFPIFGGDAQLMNAGSGDAFVLRLTSSLVLTRGTYLGGGKSDTATAIAVHPATGDVYVAGTTSSTNFPGTSGSAQATFGGGAGDAFVARLTATLTAITRAAYLGGTGDERGSALAIHPTTGDVYVAGSTESTSFPHTAGGAQPTAGGMGDVFVTRLNSALTSVIQATYLGGSGSESLDGLLTFGKGLAIHAATGDVYVAGSTGSTNFPHTAGGAQAANGGVTNGFVARLNSALTSVIQATYLGDEGPDVATALAIHPRTGDVYVAGGTASNNFPKTFKGAQSRYGGLRDAFVARLNSALTSVIQATFLGGESFDEGAALAIHPATGDVYVAGLTGSTDFPLTAGGAQVTTGGSGEAFVSRLTFGLAQVDPTLSVTASVNQSSFAAGQTLTAGGTVTNPGLPFVADFYSGIVSPDGSVQLFTSSGIVLGNIANLASFQPLAVSVPLGTPFSVAAANFYMHQWAASEPHGSYAFFVAAVKAGALASGPLTSDKILGLASASFSLP